MEHSFEEMKVRVSISENERYELKQALRHVDGLLSDVCDELSSLEREIHGLWHKALELKDDIRLALDGSLADIRKEEDVRDVE